MGEALEENRDWAVKVHMKRSRCYPKELRSCRQ